MYINNHANFVPAIITHSAQTMLRCEVISNSLAYMVYDSLLSVIMDLSTMLVYNTKSLSVRRHISESVTDYTEGNSSKCLDD